MARVVLMCGVAGAGKTTYAKKLEAQGFVRLSIDEEIWQRFGRYGIDYDPSIYDQHSATVEAALQERLVELIRAGRDVVVDFSFAHRKARDRYKHLVDEAGGCWELIYLKVAATTLLARLSGRRERFDANAAFPISDEHLAQLLAGFEEPADEGEIVVMVDD